MGARKYPTLRLTEFQREIVAAHEQLVFGYLRFRGIPITNENISDLNYALCRAAAKFDPARGKFRSLAYSYFTSALGSRRVNYARRAAKALVLPCESIENFGEMDPRLEGTEGDKGLQLFADDCLACSTPRRRQLIELRFIEGLPTDLIADQVGIKQRSVDAMIARGLRDIREKMGITLHEAI